MDDTISTIVYLILTLIIVLGGVLGRKKKQRQPFIQKKGGESAERTPSTESQPVKDMNPIDQFFSSLIDNQTDKPLVEMPDGDDTQISEDETKVKQPDSIPVEEGSSVFIYDDPDSPMVEIQPDENSIHDDEIRASMEDLTNLDKRDKKETEQTWEFDIRQAIIYSEILKPKF